MPNRYVRDANNVLVPNVSVGGLPNSTVVNADIANSTIQSGKISFFKSTEQTGTGSSQNVAHGLARTPSLVIVIPTNSDATTNYTFTEGTHDGTNVVVTATSGAKYKVVAL